MSGITQDWRCWCSSFVIWGVLIASLQECVIAQITPDGTLPNNSSITRDGNIFNITGGTQAGSNLFHSFGEFSVPNDGTASFNNAGDIQNIISRVTGGSVSNIDGLIRANNTANLFLINPNGIIFGRNASLNIGGSFVATTANAIGFDNQGFFSADNPNTPELLTVNPSALLFNQIRAASIQNNSVADSGLNPSSKFTATGLRVPDGRSLLLVGGDINMDGGGLFAFGGRVELGGLAGAGTVGLNSDGNNLNLSFPDGVERSDVFLSNGAGVDVTAGDGGSITINARNLEMTGGSFLFAGIESGLGFDNNKAGNIEVNATGAINLDKSSIRNQVLAEANGQGGNVNISANTLLVKDGTQVSASTRGVGKGGSLTVNAQNVQIIGTSADGQVPSGLSTSAQENSTGDAGDLTIKTNTLLVRDGAQVGAGTFGTGKGGNLTVNATDSVQLTSTTADGRFPSGLFTQAKLNTIGDAGDLLINTRQLLVRDGASVNTDTFGAGKGGNLTINATDFLQLIGTSVNRRFGSSLSTQVNPNATGDAGDLMINTRHLLVQDGSVVSVATVGAGKGGNLTINATDFVQVIGRSVDGQFGSGLSARANSNATRDAGNLTINTRHLLVRDGASVSAATFGAGKGGNLTVNATDSVQLIGESADGRFGSSLSAQANPNSTADAGNLTINTRYLLVRDGASVSANTFGAGKGGNLTVNATNSVQLISTSADGRFPSGLFASAQPNSTGDAGDLTIKTNTLRVQNGAGVTVQSLGIGTAGNMRVNARSIRLNNDALLTANTRSARVDPNREQATININSQDLIMSRNSNIFTNATGENVIGGNINIDTDILVGFENSDIRADSANFRGGNVRINAQSIFGIQFRDVESDRTSDITATGVNPESSGNVELNTRDIDPNSGLVELPTIPVDTEVAQGCYSPGYAQSKFVITGRGGLPANPKDILTPDAVQIDWVSVKPRNNNRSLPPVTSKLTTSTPKRIVEATGAMLNAKGQIVLSANSSTPTPHTSRQNPIQCNGR